jgi:hypothetical protein
MEYSDEFDDRRVIGVVTEEKPQSSSQTSPSYNAMNAPQRPMILQMSMMQQNQMPFPLISFLFPRLAMLLTIMQGGGLGSQRTRVQNITQIIRDSNGYIKEIVEFVR